MEGKIRAGFYWFILGSNLHKNDYSVFRDAVSFENLEGVADVGLVSVVEESVRPCYEDSPGIAIVVICGIQILGGWHHKGIR